MFNSKYPDANRFAYNRHVNVLFDGMHVKGRFGVSRNTNEIVGMEENALNEDLLRRELKHIKKNSIEEDSGTDKKIDLLGLAAHLVVFLQQRGRAVERSGSLLQGLAASLSLAFGSRRRLSSY